jgi:hypothetical protein
MVGTIRKASYNLRAQLDVFVREYVKLDGIKEIMELIVES